MSGLLYFAVLFFATIFVGMFIAFLGSVIWYAQDKRRRAFVARVKKQFLKNNPQLDPEEFKLRLSRLRARSGCCRAILWEEVDAKSGKPLRYFCDNCGRENIKTARGYALKEW